MPVATILQALESKRRKVVDPQRDPASDPEARLRAEQAHQAGLEHMRAGRHERAAHEFRGAAELQPQSNEYRLYERWCALRARGELPHPAELTELRRLASAAVGADPNLAFGHYVAGDLAVRDGRDREALRSLKRAAKLDPDLLDAQRLIRVAERRLPPAPGEK